MKEEVQELIHEHKYFKAIKRLFSIERLENKIDEDLLTFLNSDFGRFYKGIHDLEMVYFMSTQTFKKLKPSLLLINLESIKMFLSNITQFDVDHVIDQIIDIIKTKRFDKLPSLVDRCKITLNNKVESKYSQFKSKI